MEWRQLLFIQCFLHSIVQERRKFGPIGWNIPYEFNQSDLSACTQFLQNHLTDMDTKKAAAPTWATVQARPRRGAAQGGGWRGYVCGLTRPSPRQYMVSKIQYGGRITGDFDQLLMDTFAEKFFNQGVLAKGYELYPGYRVPDSGDIAVTRAEIEKLPSTDSPETFGMHANADLTYRTLMVGSAIDTIVETMPKTGGSAAGLSREDTVDKLCEELLGKVPQPFDAEAMKEKLRKLAGGPTAPLNIHLRQECDRLDVILSITTKTLRNLRLAIAGTVALSGDLIQALDSLYDARIPTVWLKKSWEAASLGTWFTGLLQRHAQLERWLTSGRPRAFWLTGFFNPQGFLTAVKQEVNRKHAADKWSLDDVVMTSSVLHPVKDEAGLKEEPKEGVYITGLFLEGASWSAKENRLIDSEPKKLYAPLPVIWVTGVLAKDYKAANTFQCPVYLSKRRTAPNYVCSFDLRSLDPPEKWVARGAALLCSCD